MLKSQRNYRMVVETNLGLIAGSPLEILLPLSVEFDISRRGLTSSGTASFRIYNLSENHRQQIRKDNYYSFRDTRKVWFYAGYGDNLSLAFVGRMTRAWSIREGTNFVTHIECFDLGFLFGLDPSQNVFSSGLTYKSVFETLLAQLPDVSIGRVSDRFTDQALTSVRGASFTGTPLEIIRQNCGDSYAYVDLDKAYVLDRLEYITGPVSLISSDTGLLNTPVRQLTTITFDTLFEPGLLVGQVVNLESRSDKTLNGPYKVMSLHHRGMISSAVASQATTAVELLSLLGSTTL